MSDMPEEIDPDRDLELEGDDGQGTTGHDLELDDLPEHQRAEVEEQVAGMKEAEERGEVVGH